MFRCTVLSHAVKELFWVKPRPSITSNVLTKGNAKVNASNSANDPKPSTFLPLLSHLPNVLSAVGYGSGVFPQKDHTKKVMVDLILVVEDSRAWHEENLERNAGHYSGFGRFMGAGGVAAVQGRGGWFNPYVKIDGADVKYGVVGKDALLEDLRGWTELYFAGRLHKPTLTLKGDEDVDKAKEGNLGFAAAAAVLGMGETFSKGELFTEISTLSYRGDPRMSTGAEDPNKVKKLVESEGQMERFEGLYGAALEGLTGEGIIRETDEGYEWDAGIKESRERLFGKLPLRVREIAGEERGIGKTLEGIVWQASLKQTAKGIVTAGVGKSVSYAMEKLKKGRGGGGK